MLTAGVVCIFLMFTCSETPAEITQQTAEPTEVELPDIIEEQPVIDSIPAEQKNQVADQRKLIKVIDPIYAETETEDELLLKEQVTFSDNTGSIDATKEGEHFGKYTVESVPAKDGIYDYTEETAEFPGGRAAMVDFITKNMVFPQEAQDLGIDGKVYVQFVVNTDGSIQDAKVLKGVHPLLDNEALRIVRLMPAWEPGKERGEPVRSRYSIPFRFELE